MTGLSGLNINRNGEVTMGSGNNVNRDNAYYEVQAYAVSRPVTARR